MGEGARYVRGGGVTKHIFLCKVILGRGAKAVGFVASMIFSTLPLNQALSKSFSIFVDFFHQYFLNCCASSCVVGLCCVDPHPAVKIAVAFCHPGLARQILDWPAWRR